MANPLASDLERILRDGAGPWEPYRGAHLFITGGTGFFGSWLLELLLAAEGRFDLGLRATLLTRDPEGFRKRRPHLATHPAIALLAGDVRTFEPPEGPFTHVIHGATSASARMTAEAPREMFDTIVEGTRRVLAAARATGARRLLFTSSGAVYGTQPSDLTHVPEDWPGAPDPCSPASAYGEAKRAAELLCAIAAREAGFDAVIARCFAFSGPYLPLDEHFAIGNFVRDAVRGGPIRVGGDGTPHRSYLYGADLAAWLFALLARGASLRPYNVGSERDVTIAELARAVAAVIPSAGGVEIAKAPVLGAPVARYVPSTRRAREELGLVERFSLEEGIRRMAEAARGGA